MAENETKHDSADTTYLLAKSQQEGAAEASTSETGEHSTYDLEVNKKQMNPLVRWIIFLQYPLSVWFIVGNELSERFAFYSFKSILPKYLKDYLLFNEDHATAIVHGFIFFAYATPIAGGFLADAVLGKFWTICILSLVYCLGQIVVSVTAIPGVTGYPPHAWGIALGLLLIAIGTGGIKPCVSSFGGDQFKEHQTELIMSFFAMFYFSINVGSTASSFITPIIRNQFGYAVAFAVPATLLVVATLIFVIGYKAYHHNPPTGLRNNPLLQVLKVTYCSIKNLRNGKTVQHFLDRAEGDCTPELIYDVKCVFRVVKVLGPIMIFWSLFDQHSTRFVFQADHMDRTVLGYTLTAEQVNTVNPFFVICLVPLFDRVIYTSLDYFKKKPTQLQRIGIGFLFTSASFVWAAILQIFIEKSKKNAIHVIWQIPQHFLLCIGEVLVSVTGLEFAYSQAPKSMKSFMQSFYLLTVSMGNVCVVVVAALPIPDYKYRQAIEFFFFAGLMMFTIFIFALLTRTYHYRKVNTTEESSH